MYHRVTSLILLGVLLLGSLAWAGDKAEAEAKALAAKERALVLAKSAKSDADGAFLGIVPEEVTSDIASDYGVQTGQGVLVESVVGGSPAEKARLRSNDILISVNGQKVTGPSELRVQLNKFKLGDEVSLVYKRGGNERSAAVKLEGKEREFGDMRWFSMEKEGAPVPHGFRWEGMKPSSAAFAGVVTVTVAEGDEVKAGDAVAIIEAMKMEATITASVDGKIERVVVPAATKVEGGDLIVVVS